VVSVSGYRFLKMIGQSLGEDVWLVRDEEGHEYRALCLAPDVGGDDALPGRLQALNHPLLPPTRVFRGPSDRVCLLIDRPDRTLAERFEECRVARQAGVPRTEMLAYLRVAAKALDAVLRDRGVPHLGLQPRNLLLHHGKLLIADHGVAALALLPAGYSPGQVNPRYSAPELFDHRPATTSDVYALAMIYAELVSGVHPRGRGPVTTQARRQAEPVRTSPRPPTRLDLDLLIASDRDVIARALSPEPDKRYETCTDLVNALERAGSSGAASRAGLLRGLPPILPFQASKQTESGSRPMPPRIDQIVAELADDHDPSTEPVSLDRARIRRKGWTFKFPVRLIPGAMALKMRGFASNWGGRLLQADDNNFVLLLNVTQPATTPRPKIGCDLEVRLSCRPPRSKSGLSEARLSMRVVPEMGRQSALVIEEMGPKLLESLRYFLQPCPERRSGERWPCPHPLHVYPVLPGIKLGKPLSGVSKNISLTGVNFLVPEGLTAPQVYLHWYRAEKLTPFVILAEVMRVQQIGDSGFEIGAALAVAGQ
jgi:serine/threonine protein kinase